MVTQVKQVSVSEVSAQTYARSTEALLRLLGTDEADILKISPKGYALPNGVDYCFVGLKSKDGTNYLVQAYGKEARELYEEAVMIVTNAGGALLSVCGE
ncbi:MAG: hypothetical protein WBL46_05770 [Nitrososphaeraceae archaeon]